MIFKMRQRAAPGKKGLGGIAVIGDLAVDIKGNTNCTVKNGINALLENTKISAGGVAGNMAWYLAQLGQKALVIGSVGSDCWGNLIKNDLLSFGTDCSMVSTIAGIATGFFIIAVDQSGERTMIGDRGASKNITIKTSKLISASPSWIHLSGYTLLNSNGAKVLRSVRKVAQELGINYSIDLEGIGETGAELDLEGATVLCNQDNCAERVRHNAKVTVIKSGKDGCFLDYHGRLVQHRPPPTNSVDATGAGDSFNAAFITACMTNVNYDLACDMANAVATYKVGLRGARVKLPAEFRRYFLTL
ncbi:MAG: carbohydrate kinase family protein [Nitrososphaerota archaeon]|jgi:sugar/nucleoside kinase (ribokinase family)|nr:carbohydrate kinase family protein [Nitrososphaerota archaeon]MDG6927370.1 carbohydrate kinase family protein [Nitrososphaerota archaeon]MDG6931071.1 carbohydrate kinase family protein [Nitrososphaerota archaeon]MDG6932202.1 carbohydrate kinase family protein [Nitrososphaerota archaeon]MDG6935265.1 carbohydrate kinase family protein [Nitrososphaerota archaeon]